MRGAQLELKIDELKPSKFPGPDEVCPGTFKERREEVSNPLANLFIKTRSSV